MSAELPVIVEICIARLAPYQHDYSVLPLRDALVAYRDEGRPVGDFLRALLSNDLLEAVGRADHVNTWLLPVYVGFLYNELPSPAWGSQEKVSAWIATHEERRAARAAGAAATNTAPPLDATSA
jgi:hypothetical protein